MIAVEITTFLRLYRVGQKSDTSRTLHYIVREVSLFWPTLYNDKVVKITLKFISIDQILPLQSALVQWKCDKIAKMLLNYWNFNFLYIFWNCRNTAHSNLLIKLQI